MPYLDTLNNQWLAMTRGIVASLPNITMALVVVLLTWFVARFAVRIADWLTGKSTLRADLQNLIETVVRVGIWVVGLLLAATVAIPGFTPGSMIAGLGIGALAIGFAFQDIFENFLAGVLIMVRDKMNIGDAIEADGISGTVEKITLRETHVRQFSNELVIVPNSQLFKNRVTVLTDAIVRRDEVLVGVDYEADFDAALAAVKRGIGGVAGLDPNREPAAFVREFGASSIDILAQWWVLSGSHDMRVVRTEVMKGIKRELDAAGIGIPYPHVTQTFADAVPLRTVAEAA